MKIQQSRAEIDQLICTSYGEIGGDIREIGHIRPEDGEWESAQLYEVTLKDGRRSLVSRQDLDDKNVQAIRDSLKVFH